MADDRLDLVRTAFSAYARGDIAGVLESVDPDLEWTFLDPSEAAPKPRICRGREQLERWLPRQMDRGVHPVVEELVEVASRVLVVTHIAGLDGSRAREADDRNYHLVTVENGTITALRACRSRAEAIALATTGS